ncbi:hypothetical protein SAMN05519103_02086 [Rhizobiales bacterium GAS113]|nr:hypothetical protein SAMN05519103_02086 [Rhizobiales bacterium GAS113]
MSIEPDDLHKPLGLSTGRSGHRFKAGARSLAAAALVGAGVGVFSFLAREADHAGEPYAMAEIAPAAPESVGTIAKTTPAKTTPEEAAGPARRLSSTGAEIESDSGVTVIRPGGASAPDALVIRVPDAFGPIRLAAAPDPRLVERGEFGPLPRIGPDGARPAQIYARPAPAAATKGRPRIALIVGGLGLNEQTTAAAMTKLPGEVSLAFAPYGANLKAQAMKAREIGHEILLQMPMEPFDYPQNNPGPQTLTTEAGAAQNLERLHWAMARAAGFVGIENFLGARFTADEAAVTPILKDLAARGLIFIDDGSSARSIAPAIAASLNLGVRRADIVIDAAPNAAMIDAALSRLEALSRDRGLACASASALPITIERLSAWAASLGERGIDLVPVTATLSLKGRS